MTIRGTLPHSPRMCLRGFTSRCSTSKLLGTTTLPGAQAQYIRIPNAGGSLLPAISTSTSFPSQAHSEEVPSAEDELRQEALALLLADILPTGYFAAKQAWEHPNLSGMLNQIRDCPDEPKIQLAIHFAILGLGPVGLVSLCPLGPDIDRWKPWPASSDLRLTMSWGTIIILVCSNISHSSRFGVGLLPCFDCHIRSRSPRESKIAVSQDG